MSRKPNAKPKRITAKHVQAEDERPVQLPQVDAKPEVDDHEDTDNDGLTLRRRMFVEHITGRAMGNATRAAELAGYASDNKESLKATAARLLSIVYVQKAIARRLAAMRLTPESITHDIAKIAAADMANFLKVGPDGQPQFDWVAANASGAIGQMREYMEDGFIDGNGKVTIIKRKFKLHDPRPALELLARIKGMLVEQHNHSVDLNVKGYDRCSPDDWDRSQAQTDRRL